VLTRILMLLLTLRETYALNRLSSFKNLRRKGGKFDHRPGRPKVVLRHCSWQGACCTFPKSHPCNRGPLTYCWTRAASKPCYATGSMMLFARGRPPSVRRFVNTWNNLPTSWPYA